MELNKTIPDLKMEVETIKKTQRKTTPEIEILGKKSGPIDASISNRIQQMEQRISGVVFHGKHGHNNQEKSQNAKRF
jgi:prefoldin subunit 5